MSTDVLWTLLAAFGGVLLGAWLNRGIQKWQWRTDQRRRVYGSLLQRVEEFQHLCRVHFNNLRQGLNLADEARSIEAKGYELHIALKEVRIFGSPGMQTIVEDIEENIGNVLYTLGDRKHFEETWDSRDPATGIGHGVVYAFMEYPDEIFAVAQADLAAHSLSERWAYWRRGRAVVRQRREARRKRLRKEREKTRAREEG